MKRYSDLMKNGVIRCDKEECVYCYDGKCCHFASPNENDGSNDVCQGKYPSKKAEPMKIGYFRTDFSDVDTDTLIAYKEMFDNLATCMDLESPNVTDVWKVLYRMGSLVQNELSDRKGKAYLKEKAREKRKKQGLPVPKVHKKVIRPLKAKR